VNAYISDIVNNTLCADLLDYLKRDVYFCNLQQAFGDRFMRYLSLETVSNDPKLVKEHKGPATSKRLVVRISKPDSTKYRRDVLSELVDLLRARYTLGEKVYYHLAKVSSSAMVARAILSAMTAESGEQLTLQKIMSVGDDELLAYLAETSGSPIANKIAKFLLNHQLYKLAYTLTRKEAEAVPGVQWASELVQRYYEGPVDYPMKAVIDRTEVEDQIAGLCGLKPGDVLVYCTDLEMAKKYARMLVDWKSSIHMLRDIDDEATSIALNAIEKSHDLLWSLRVFVNPTVKDARILQIIRDFCDFHFLPPVKGDADRRLEAAYRNLVSSKMESTGTDEVVRKLVAAHRGRRTVTQDDVQQVIEETRKRGIVG